MRMEGKGREEWNGEKDEREGILGLRKIGEMVTSRLDYRNKLKLDPIRLLRFVFSILRNAYSKCLVDIYIYINT